MIHTCSDQSDTIVQMNPKDPPDVTPGKRGRTAVNPPDSKTAFSLSETEWRALIIASTALVILFSVYCLSNGITTIFMHLYYFPIVLLAYRYRMKGAVLAALLAVAYVVLVVIYDYGQTDVITGAFYRFIVFVAIAAVVGFLSEQLFRVQRSLKESSDVHERYISLAPAIILVLDTNGTIMHLNTFGCSILGCSVLEAEGKPWIDTFIREEERDTIHQIFESILRGDIETYRETEHEVITLDGVPRIIMWHNTVLTDDAGKITGVLSYGEDITGRKRDEVTIHALQQFQEGIITNANVWIMVLTPKGKILVWNNAAEAISGYTGEETLGTTGIWKRLYPDPAYRKWVTGEIARVITRDTYLEDFETGIRCRDGTKKTIAWNTKGLRNAGGSVENYIAVGRDVTERRKAEDEIARSEEKYRTLVEQISDVIYSLDGRGVITYISPAIEKITGYSPSEITGRDFRQFIYRDDLPLVKEIFENGKNNRVKSFQFRIVDRAGEVRWLRVSSKPSIENGKFLGINGVMLDITDQKRSEEALQKSQSLLSNAMDLAHMASWELDVTTGIFTFDDRFYALYGTTAEHEGGYRMPAEVYARKFVHPDDRAVVGEETQNAIETPDPGYTSQLEHRIIRRDGTVRYIIVRIGITKDREGRTIRTHGANQDITEWRQAEEALRESEQKFRDLFENSQDGIAISEISSRKIVDSNHKFSRMLGYNPEEIKNLGVQDIHPKDSLAHAIEIFEKMVRHETSLAENVPVKRKDGTIFYADISAYLISASGKSYMVGVFRDITERKQAELELKKLASIVEHSSEFVGLSNPEGEIIFLNDAGARMIGVDPKDVISRKFVELIPEHEVEILRNEILPALHRKESWEGDLQLLNQRTGRPVDVHSMTFTISDPVTGKPLYLANISLDITERKRMEGDLRKSNDMNISLFAVIPDIIFILSEKGEFIDYRGGSKAGLYTPPDQFLGRTIDELLPPDIASLAHRKMQEVLATGTISTFEYSLDMGEIRHYHARMTRFGQDQFFCIIQDMTERKQMEEALRRSEEKYRGVTERSSDIIMLTDQQGQVTYIAPSVKKILGYSPDEVIGSMPADLIHPDYLDAINNLIRKKAEGGGGTGEIEILVRKKDGDYAILDISISAIIQNDIFSGLQVIGRDITDRKMAEDALRKSEEKYRAYIQNALEGIFISDKTGRYLDVNPSACRLTGYTRDEMLNLTIADLSGPGDHGAGLNGFKTLLTDGRVVREILLKRKDGTLVPVILNAVMLPDGNLIGFCTDITERKQIEEALRKSEEKYRDYIENAVEGIFIADKTGRYIDVNPSACRLVGYTRDELLSLTIADLFAPDVLATAKAAFQEILKKGRMALEIPLKRKDGTFVTVILNAVMLPDGKVMGFCTDITERKMTEDALALASRKLNLLSSITRHDILNQLMVLIGYLDMALEEVTDPEQRHFIEVEMQAAKTIQRQIEFTREYQELGLQAPVWLNINKYLMQATLNLPIRDVTVSIDRTDLEVYADRLFEKVFYNLIDNALRYGGDGMTLISVLSHEDEKGLVIIFEDNGAGITAEDKQKLFTRGFGKNTGLGLFLSREILAITGITIDETGEPGKGARFEITVPKGMYRFTGGNPEGASP